MVTDDPLVLMHLIVENGVPPWTLPDMGKLICPSRGKPSAAVGVVLSAVQRTTAMPAVAGRKNAAVAHVGTEHIPPEPLASSVASELAVAVTAI